MKKAGWRTKIKSACRLAGTYRECFDKVIDTLAGILEMRDQAAEEFKESGGQILVQHVTRTGAVNMEQNPALRLINDLNRDALAYWRDLGLTPAGLKKIDEDAMKPKKMNRLEKALMDLA